MFCQTCPKKDLCSQLCPEAEAYANQDHQTAREFFSFPEARYGALPDPPSALPHLSKTELKVVMLTQKGFSRAEISFLLKLSRPALAVNISRIRSKCKGFPVLPD